MAQHRQLGSDPDFRAYISCMCCELHQRNRPVSAALWREIEHDAASRCPEESNKLQTDPVVLRCACPCRHRAREMCRRVFGVFGANISHADSRSWVPAFLDVNDDKGTALKKE